jgi:hypothetical protein
MLAFLRTLTKSQTAPLGCWSYQLLLKLLADHVLTPHSADHMVVHSRWLGLHMHHSISTAITRRSDFQTMTSRQPSCCPPLPHAKAEHVLMSVDTDYCCLEGVAWQGR